MNRSIRLTVVQTHPVQYMAPWFRHIAKHCPEIDLTVLYATQPTRAQQGVGFGEAFDWDVALLEGYPCRVVRAARPQDRVHSDDFWGLDVPEIGSSVLESRPDVVLIAGWHSITLLRALRASRRARIPVLYRGDTHLGNAPHGWRRPLWTIKTWLLLRSFTGYLSVGSRTRKYLRQFGAHDARVWEAPHCVDNAFFAQAAAVYQTPTARATARASWGLAADDFVVLFVGKLEPKKRPLDLVGAMARLGREARLLVVGSGALERACRDEAVRLGVQATWAGFLNQGELGRAYAAADCLALPSDWGETWGLVVNEALATGLPCVVSDRVGCAPDLVTPGETGEVFPATDAAALADALTRVRDGWRAGHDWASACRERADRYSIERATAGLRAACRAVSQRRVSPASPRVVACCGGMVIVAGTERMTFEVLRVLHERGASIHCIVNSWANARIVALAEQIGASWSSAPYRQRFDRHARNPVTWVRLLWDIGQTSLGLLRDARRTRATHILLPEFVAVLRNAPALALLRWFGVRVILQLGNAPDPGSFYRRLWRWSIYPFVDRFVCNSRFTQAALRAHGISGPTTSMIYNCAPRRPPSSPPSPEARDPGRLIYVGQIIPGKGLDLLLEATALLLVAGYDVRLDVVGDIDGWEAPAWRGYHATIRARAGQPDLAGRVRFLGWREDVPELLSRAAIHCCPSRPEIREGFGLVNIEAKAAGLPSVVFPTGALPELIVHAEDGWVCAEASAAALAEGIEYFLADSARRERAGEAAKRSASRFNRDEFANAWWAVFTSDAAPSRC